MARPLPPERQRELDARLRAEAGVTLDSLQAAQLARLARLRAAGRLTTEAQYHLVRERVEFIWDEPAHADEFAALQALLTGYEDGVARRVARAGARQPGA